MDAVQVKSNPYASKTDLVRQVKKTEGALTSGKFKRKVPSDGTVLDNLKVDKATEFSTISPKGGKGYDLTTKLTRKEISKLKNIFG